MSEIYRVLAIPGARDGDGGPLDLDTEISLLSNISDQFGTIHIDLIEDATELGIAEILALGSQSYDAVHWLGHSDDGGFYLSEDEYLTQAKLQKICIDAGARTVFLNSCVSGRIGQFLVNNKMAVALCYSTPVFDQDALLCALRFYSTLAKSNDPFEDGLKEAYNAADPGDGTLLWLTNGQYIAEIIRPIIDRLDAMNVTHESSFAAFNQVLGATRNIVQGIDDRLSKQIAGLTANTKHTRYALISLIAIVLVSTFALGWLMSSIRSTSAHALATATVEEPATPTWELTPTWTPRVPPKNTHGATPQKPTRKPTHTKHPTDTGGTVPTPPAATESILTPGATDAATVLATTTATSTEYVTSTPTPRGTPTATAAQTLIPETPQNPTREPTSTRRVTPVVAHTATIAPSPTHTPTPIHIAVQTPTDAPEPSLVPVVTMIPVPSSTLTPFELAVQLAVEATIAAGGCICQR